jgi:hypothetical protein
VRPFGFLVLALAGAPQVANAQDAGEFAALGVTYAYYPSEGRLSSGHFGLLGQLQVYARSGFSFALEGRYQPLSDETTRYRGFSAFPPPGRFVDQTQSSTRTVASVGILGTLRAAGPLRVLLAVHAQRFSREATSIERDSTGTLLTRTSRTVAGIGPSLQLGLSGQLPELGPLRPRLEVRGVVATVQSEGTQAYFYPVAALVIGFGRGRR